jgi:hypothetical protein
MANATPNKQAFFTSSYVFGNGTTSTIALLVWKAVSDCVNDKNMPMTGEELSKSSGLTVEQLENMFSQAYYKKYYGFRRFETLAQWESWAKEHEVFFVPGVHDVPEADAEPDLNDEEAEALPNEAE